MQLNEDEVLVFADIETTGLSPEKDYILEVGLVVTDLQLKVLGQWQSLVLNEGWRARLAGDQFVWDMHTKSGLIDDLDSIQDIPHLPGHNTPQVVAWAAYKWLTEDMGLPEGKIPCFGSSAHFDREHLRAQRMAVLDSFFSHRIVDVSGLKELCRRYNKELYESIKKQFSKDDAAHRALLDIFATINELKVYIENFLFVPGNELDTISLINHPVLPGLESLR